MLPHTLVGPIGLGGFSTWVTKPSGTTSFKVGDVVVVIGGRMSGMSEMMEIKNVTEGKSNGHIIKDSDEFFYNPSMALSYAKNKSESL